MTITRIEVTTYDGVYTEEYYSLMETINRVEEIQRCDNVIGVEVMNIKTGEVLYYETLTGEEYVAETLVLDLAKEVLD